MQKRTPNPDDVKLSVTVSREVWLRLKDLATRQRRSLNDLLNEWIESRLSLPPEEGRKGGEVEYTRSPSSRAMLCADG